MTFLEFLFYQEMNKMPTHKVIHIAKSLEKPTARAKTCQRVCLCQRYKLNVKNKKGHNNVYKK